jgi:hypothetical protein
MAKQYKVTYEFDPFELTGLEKPKGVPRREILKEIRDFTVEAVVGYVNTTRSPVQGHGKFKRLTRDYKKRKVAAGGSSVPDLLLSGDMLSALKAPIKGVGIELGIKGKQGPKADGHNNHSGDSELPLRRFIPDEDDGETFKKPIIDGMKKIIRSFEK